MAARRKIKKQEDLRTWFGWIKVQRTTCYNCDGEGTINPFPHVKTGMFVGPYKCPECQGKKYTQVEVEPTMEEIKEIMFNKVLNKCNKQ